MTPSTSTPADADETPRAGRPSRATTADTHHPSAARAIRPGGGAGAHRANGPTTPADTPNPAATIDASVANPPRPVGAEPASDEAARPAGRRTDSTGRPSRATTADTRLLSTAVSGRAVGSSARSGTRPGGRLAVVLVPVLAVLVVLAGAGAAEAAGYRYWSFWRGADGGWAYQQQGPAVAVPADGAVDGWRFAVSPDGGQDAAKPRTGADFATVCAGTPAQQGRKRVAVVLDFGTPEDAGSAGPPPEQRTLCASVAPSATSAEVLAAVAPPLRYDTNGLLCAISGFPKAGCADQLGSAAQPAGAAPGSSSSSGPNLGLIAGGALVAVLAAGAVWQSRRRRST
ncbi:SCO2322 family protein [Kitasatospora sp. NPDC051170]|uniref:SCO2322 family protein n=1 Tax=Kitasatospora sp. NPDC051170 TaxID=3364056 RepID=UPI0037B2D0C8